MKRLILLLSICLFASCSFGNLDVSSFVGTYTVSVVENAEWGYDSGVINDNGTFTITKTFANRVQVSGYITTQGTVSGSNLYLEGNQSMDNTGYITTSYGVGTLSGNVLTFTAYQTGQLKASNGIQYPYRSTGYFTAIKID